MDIIRKAEMRDLMHIVNIYNQAVSARNCTCDLENKELNDRINWYKEHNEKTPIYVYERNNDILGYSYISAYREGREAVSTTGEVSFYVDHSHHRKGIGSSLLEFTMQQATELGYTHLLAILIECNVGSIALLHKFGFQEWGRLLDIVHIDNRRLSHLYYGISLCSMR